MTKRFRAFLAEASEIYIIGTNVEQSHPLFVKGAANRHFEYTSTRQYAKPFGSRQEAESWLKQRITSGYNLHAVDPDELEIVRR